MSHWSGSQLVPALQTLWCPPVFSLTFHTYSRPIHAPVKYLRPARETCERCHWPQRFIGDKFVVKTTYKDDEKNTPQTIAMLLKKSLVPEN